MGTMRMRRMELRSWTTAAAVGMRARPPARARRQIMRLASPRQVYSFAY